MNLCRVDSVAAVVTLAVGHMLNQTFVLPQFPANQGNDVDVLHFIVAADVIDFADTALAKDEVDSPAVIFYVEPVTDVEAVTVDRKSLVVQSVDDS
mgnify:CR=1 FL=1